MMFNDMTEVHFPTQTNYLTQHLFHSPFKLQLSCLYFFASNHNLLYDEQGIDRHATPMLVAGAAAVGVTSTTLTVLCAVRFMMSLFPAAERRQKEAPWHLLVTATDPILEPVRGVLQPVRSRPALRCPTKHHCIVAPCVWRWCLFCPLYIGSAQFLLLNSRHLAKSRRS